MVWNKLYDLISYLPNSSKNIINYISEDFVGKNRELDFCVKMNVLIKNTITLKLNKTKSDITICLNVNVVFESTSRFSNVLEYSFFSTNTHLKSSFVRNSAFGCTNATVGSVYLNAGDFTEKMYCSFAGRSGKICTSEINNTKKNLTDVSYICRLCLYFLSRILVINR